MRRRSVRGLLVACACLAVGSSCTDRIPTLSEAGDLAPGASPTTIQYELGTADVLKSARVRPGQTDVDDASYLLVANRFDDVLSAHTLARFRAFPDTIDLLERVDSQFTYLSSEVIATVPDSLQASHPLLDFELWTVTQPWDSLAVSWENAVDRPGEIVPWITAGGTRGRLLGMARWERAASSDSIVWDVGPDVLESLAAGEIPGLMVTLQQAGSRAQISALTIRASIRPSIQQDTAIVRTIGPKPHNFIFTPDPPQPDELLRVGGITSDRSYILIDLSKPIPTCADVAPEACQRFASPEEVSLNRVELLLDPVPVTQGYRPIAPLSFFVRRVLKPELGERAPLGPPLALDTLTVAQGAGTSGEPVAINLTAAVEGLLRGGETELAVAILAQPEGSLFSYAWFARNARLRFVYTLPQRPELP